MPEPTMNSGRDDAVNISGADATERMSTLKRARLDLATGDHATLASTAGGVYLPERNVIETHYLGRPYEVDCAIGTIEPVGHERYLSGLENIIVLHSLNRPFGRQPTGRWVSYREFKGGASYYYDSFKRRSIDVLMRAFGLEPERLLLAADRMPCERSVEGDASVKIRLLPKMPVIFAVWGGNEEMMPSATILFDLCAPDYLPLEDLAVAASCAVRELIEVCAD